MAPLTYTVAEVAELLGISQSHVRRLARAGDLPTLAIRGRTLFSRAAIHTWVDEQGAA